MLGIQRRLHRRLAIIAAVLLAMFCFLVVQFFQVQIIEGKKWEAIALSQHQKSINTPFKRGRILATLKRPVLSSSQEKHPALAFDVLSYHLFSDNTVLPQQLHEEIAHQLASFFPADNLKPFLKVNLAKKSRGRLLKKWVSEEKKKQIQHWWNYFRRSHGLARNALFFTKDYRRSYPFGHLLGSALCSVREDRDPKTQKHYPVGGLELYYDHVLQGMPGKKRQLKSLNNPLVVTEVVAREKDGKDLVLHVDPYIQAICEEEIHKTCMQIGAKKASCIVMDPYSGAIMALAQYPFFDPSDYRRYFNQDAHDLTRVGVLSDPFEPGSTFKPITMAITLTANEYLKAHGKSALFDPNKMVKIGNGALRGREKTPIKDVGRHRYLNMFHAIEKSSNIYMAQVIESMVARLGDHWYQEQLQRLGFGAKTGIDIPSESRGFVPKVDGLYKNGAMQWSLITPYSLGFGYNLSVNAAQMLKVWAALINGGMEVRPHIGNYVRGDSGVVFLNPIKEQKQLFSQQVCAMIKKSLFLVCQSPRGTARRSKLGGYSMGGKTSTTEKLVGGAYNKEGKNVGTMMGFFPYERPQFLIFLNFDEPDAKYLPGIGSFRLSGRYTAPTFKKILARIANYVGLEPDDPGTLSPKDPRYKPVQPMLSEQMQTLNKLYSEWN